MTGKRTTISKVPAFAEVADRPKPATQTMLRSGRSHGFLQFLVIAGLALAPFFVRRSIVGR